MWKIWTAQLAKYKISIRTKSTCSCFSKTRSATCDKKDRRAVYSIQELGVSVGAVMFDFEGVQVKIGTRAHTHWVLMFRVTRRRLMGSEEFVMVIWDTIGVIGCSVCCWCLEMRFCFPILLMMVAGVALGVGRRRTVSGYHSEAIRIGLASFVLIYFCCLILVMKCSDLKFTISLSCIKIWIIWKWKLFTCTAKTNK